MPHIPPSMRPPAFPYDLSKKPLSRVRRVHRRPPGAARPTPVAPKPPSTSLADAIEHLQHIFADWSPSARDVEFSIQFHDREVAIALQRSIVSRIEPWLFSGTNWREGGFTVCGIEFKIPPPPAVSQNWNWHNYFRITNHSVAKTGSQPTGGKNAPPDERLEDAPQAPAKPPTGGAT